jgi:hypothetical protein
MHIMIYKKYFFTDRVTHIWNSLPDTVLSDNINTFKIKWIDVGKIQMFS